MLMHVVATILYVHLPKVGAIGKMGVRWCTVSGWQAGTSCMDTVASYLHQVGDVCAKVAKFEDCMTITLDCRVASLVQLCMYSGVASVSTKNRGKCEKKSKEKFTGNFCQVCAKVCVQVCVVCPPVDSPAHP